MTPFANNSCMFKKGRRSSYIFILVGNQDGGERVATIGRKVSSNELYKVH